MVLFSFNSIAFILLAAGGYFLATIGMKSGSHMMGGVAFALIVAGLVTAALAEITILRRADLGVIYIAIIGVETLLVLTYVALIGEGLSLRQLSGAGLVLVGLAVVSA